MGRAPNSGGPQRVSPHVVPKAKPFSEDDEKTNIEAESQWGDEASTTVEQGEVADKMRALGLDTQPPPAARRGNLITNVTNTGALDESTVDDQNPMLVRPPIAPARLVITGGNDTGLESDITPGKKYTIGRGLDNDIVLTDIAVSRKHFDLRNDNGSWVIVDRGSGNGTVVNGNLEDNPFMLANGDVIEIGTTTFRFDFQQTVDEPRRGSAEGQRGVDVVPRGQHQNGFDADDEEMSTVAGKPLNGLNGKLLDSVDVELETASPLVAGPRTQPRPKTLPPPAPLRPRTMSQPPAYPSTQPQGTPGPMPATTLPMPQMQVQMRAQSPSRAPMSGPHAPTMLAQEPVLLAGVMPTTIPGQGVSQPPLNNSLQPTQMYNGYPQATEIPPHSNHAQQMLIAAGMAKRGDGSTAHVQPSPFNVLAVVPPQRYSSASPISKRAKYVIVLGAVMVFATIATVAIIKSGDGKKVAAKAATTGSAATGSATTGSAQVTPIQQKPPQQTAIVTPSPVQPLPVQKPTPPPSNPIVPKQDFKPDHPIAIVKQDPKPDPKPVAPVKPQQTNQAKIAPVQRPKTAPPKSDPPVQRPKVATADPTDRATSLYQDKKFTEAASLYLSASKTTSDPDDASAFKLKGQRLQGLAHSYNAGTAQAVKATDAFNDLIQANNYDVQLGGHFESDISSHLATITPKAALGFIISKNFDMAHTAVQKADALGLGGDGSIKAVRQKLESEALALYQQAIKDLDTDPKGAKDKLRQVKQMVDSKSPTYQKAVSKLNGN